MSSEQAKPVVLAVDDTPENIDVVRGILAPDQREALDMIAVKIGRILNGSAGFVHPSCASHTQTGGNN